MPDLPIPTLRCQKCAQGFKISLTDVYNNLPPKFCPICGTPTLQKAQERVTKSAHTGQTIFVENVACFAGIDPELVAILYQNWRYYDAKEQPHVKQPHRFIDYLKEALS
jgi:NADH pyrophosphatase NudC (nudix superfamily)